MSSGEVTLTSKVFSPVVRVTVWAAPLATSVSLISTVASERLGVAVMVASATSAAMPTT